MGPPETENPPTVAAVEGPDPSDFGKRLNRYGIAKRYTREVLAELGQERSQRMGLAHFERVATCCDWMKFRNYYTVGEIRLASASFCKKHLVCGVCAIRRASKMMAAYLSRFQVIRKDHPTLRPWLVTLTVRNTDDFGEGLEHLLASLRTLHRRRNRPNQPSIMHGIAGGVYAVEVTHGRNGWHPHVHAIWLSDEDPGTLRLRSEWESITTDSFMCDVRPIEAQEQENPDIDPHAGGFAECFKYAMKPAELGAGLLEVAYPHLLGRRLVGSFGLFRGVQEPDSYADDLTDMASLPYLEYLFRYSEKYLYRHVHTANVPAVGGVIHG